MLHIILLILKIIGWILLAILGLIVLLICITIFVPLRYQADGSCKGTLESLYGKIKFSWFCHLISGFAVYENGKLDWTIRIAWKKLRAEEEVAVQAEEDFPYKEEVLDKEEVTGKGDVLDKGGLDWKETPKKDKSADKKDAPKEEAVLSPIKGNLPANRKAPSKGQGGFSKLKDLYQKIIRKIREFYEKIKYTIQKFCDTIEALLVKKEKLESFITDEIHKAAFAAGLVEVKRLLRFLKPKKLTVDVHFGFEDPCITGQVLALLSVVYPFIGEHADIQPDFEQKILEGEVMASGKIRFLYIVIIGWNLIWNKNVRTTFRHVRKFEL